jgi:predicted DNA-binding transcriptional regulator AlpA
MQKLLLTATSAAELLDMRVSTFKKKVKAGILPKPIPLFGQRLPRWDPDAFVELIKKNNAPAKQPTLMELIYAHDRKKAKKA